MNDFIKNIYRPGNEKHACPCLAVKEVREFTYDLLRKTRPSLQEKEMKKAAENLIAEAQSQIKKEKKNQAEAKRRYLLRRAPRLRPRSSPSTSSASDSKTDQESATSSVQSGTESQELGENQATEKRVNNVSKNLATKKEGFFRRSSSFRPRNPSSSSSSASDFVPLKRSTPKPQLAPAGKALPQPEDTPKGKSSIPVLKRRFSSMRESQKLQLEVSNQRTRASMSSVQLIPLKLVENKPARKSRSNSFASKLPVVEKNRWALSRKSSFSWREASASEDMQGALRDLRDSLQEIVLSVSSILNRSFPN